MQFLKIWLLCIVAAVVYGIIHDQVTAHFCVEYFTIGHPPVFHTQSPTLLAFGWGVIATWWMGAFLGFFIGLAATFGSYPKLSVSALIKPVLVLMLIMALCAFAAGVFGYFATKSGLIAPLDYGGIFPPNRALRFMADYWSHSTSYATGFFGAIGISFWIIWRRRQLHRAKPF